MAEQFTLRWNKFHSNVSAGFVALLEDEELVDVTLAAEGHLVRAHKLVLSICSPYFKRMFKQHPCDHPVVILKDVPMAELRDILQFMYRGEVNISQRDLSSFLATAELLQVRGLTENAPELPFYEDEPEPPAKRHRAPSKKRTPDLNELNPPPAPSPLPPHPDILDSTNPLTPHINDSCDSDSDPTPLTYDPYRGLYDSLEATGGVKLEPGEAADSPFAALAAAAAKEKSKSNKDPAATNNKNRKIGNYQCLLCHRLFTSRYNLKIHMRDKHYSVEDTLQCHICQKRMRNQSCLRVHLYHHRKQAANVAAMMPPQASATLLQQQHRGGAQLEPEEAETPPTGVAADTPAAHDEEDRPPPEDGPPVDEAADGPTT